MIKFETKKVIEVSDFDDLVEKTYGRPYSFQQQEGCKPRGTVHITVPEDGGWDFENDTIPEKVNGDEMGVSFKAWLERDPNQIAPFDSDWENRLFWHRNFYPDFSMVINDLHEKGLFPAGDYVINIDW